MTRKLSVFSYQPVSLCIMWEPQGCNEVGIVRWGAVSGKGKQ